MKTSTNIIIFSLITVLIVGITIYLTHDTENVSTEDQIFYVSDNISKLDEEASLKITYFYDSKTKSVELSVYENKHEMYLNNVENYFVYYNYKSADDQFYDIELQPISGKVQIKTPNHKAPMMLSSDNRILFENILTDWVGNISLAYKVKNIDDEICLSLPRDNIQICHHPKYREKA